jgi:hypothetical protein
LRPGRSAIVGPVGEVAATYASPDGQAVDSRLQVTSVRLSERGAFTGIKTAIAPGAALTLDVALRVNQPLPRARIDFEIVRQDGLVMFRGSPVVDGEPPLDLEAGMTLAARIHFRANLLRGTYRVVLHVIDSHKLWPPIAVSGLASFVVHETTRVMGCSEVEPAYEIEVSPSEDSARLLRVV